MPTFQRPNDRPVFARQRLSSSFVFCRHPASPPRCFTDRNGAASPSTLMLPDAEIELAPRNLCGRTYAVWSSPLAL